MNKPERPNIDKYREGLVCLVPKQGSSYGITCHEKTLCDCQVLEIFAALDQARADAIEMARALESIAAEKCKPSFDEELPNLERSQLISTIKTDTEIAREALTPERRARYLGAE